MFILDFFFNSPGFISWLHTMRPALIILLIVVAAFCIWNLTPESKREKREEAKIKQHNLKLKHKTINKPYESTNDRKPIILNFSQAKTNNHNPSNSKKSNNHLTKNDQGQRSPTSLKEKRIKYTYVAYQYHESKSKKQ